MKKYKIKTATACYTGGGIYIYYGQFEDGLFFTTSDLWDVIGICNANPDIDDDEDFCEFYEAHLVDQITGEDFKTLWNQILQHILNGGEALGEWLNYSASDLERRMIK